MTELGNRLKEARLDKGLSLDDLQTMTKIQKRYLNGIEEGNYASMPGNFYVRAFIKQYAEALELNPDEIFETYKSEIPATYNEELPQQLSRVKTNKALADGSSKIFDVLPKILIGVFIIGVASVVYYFFTTHSDGGNKETKNNDREQVNYETNEKAQANEGDKTKDSDNQEEEKDQTVNEDQKTEDGQKLDESNQQKDEETSTTEETTKQELTAVQSSGKNSTYELKNADKFVVKLVSKGQTWVSIKNGKGKTFYQGTLKVGGTESQTQDLSAESSAVIRVGNAADTEIYVNDQKLEYAIPATANVQNITIQYVLKTE